MTETTSTSPTPNSKLQSTIAYFIFLQSFVATLGSLYYSTFGDPVKNILEGNPFPYASGLMPCELCWFARILMYPIVILSAVGMIKEDKKFTDYILPLSVIGIFLDIFHYGLQKFNWQNPFGCTLANPCNALQVEYLGFITIPFLALTAFIVITILSVWHRSLNAKDN
jgi:disulfide bond formation protein DsbB